MTPKSLADKSEGELHGLLLDCVSQMEKNGNAGSYIESTLKAVKSWLNHNGKEVRRKIRIRGARETPSLKDERVPTKEELKHIVLSGDKKARVACILVAHSGVRIEVLGNYTGTDGLVIRDFPDLKIERESVSFAKQPALLTVRRQLSKAGHQYFTFLSEEGCEYLKDYLEERIRNGESLTPDSPLITPKLRMKPFIRANNIGDTIRDAMRTAGLKWRPYVLRSYFDTQLMLAESKGLVLRDYRQFWMGHKGDIENRYTTNKQRLPESVVEDMRAAYTRSQEFLQTTKQERMPVEELRKKQVMDMVKVLGFSEDKIKKVEEALAKYENTDEALEEIKKLNLNAQMEKDRKEHVRADAMHNRKETRIVRGDDKLVKFLNDGWDLVKELSADKFVMQKSLEESMLRFNA